MQAQIDYTSVEPVPYKKTVAYINNFIINTTQFLNRFSYLCEKKLGDVASQIQRLEITMSILEVKLASIPGLDGSAPPPSQQQQQQPQQANANNTGAPPPPPPPLPGTSSSPSVPTSEPPAPQSSGLTMKEDPRYMKYFKMQRIGIAPPQIQQKMMLDGLDPSVLDTPDAPSDYHENSNGNNDNGRQDDGSGSDTSGSSSEEEW